MIHRISLQDRLDGAAVEDAALSAYRDAHDCGLTLQGRLRHVLAATGPLIRAEDRGRLAWQAKDAAVMAWVAHADPGSIGATAVSVVPMEMLKNLLDNGFPEDPMPDNDTGVITVRFPPDGAEKRYRASGFGVDDDGNLTLFTGTHKTAWFPAGSHWGAHEEPIENQVITESGSA